MNSLTVGKFISERRKSLNLTQQELAIQIGVTNKAVSRWETGEGYPDITVITKLASCLCVTTDELLSSEIALNSDSHALNESRASYSDYIIKSDSVEMHDNNAVFLSEGNGRTGRNKTFHTAIAVTMALALILFFVVSSTFHTSAASSTEKYEGKLSKVEEKINKDYSWKIYKVWPNEGM